MRFSRRYYTSLLQSFLDANLYVNIYTRLENAHRLNFLHVYAYIPGNEFLERLLYRTPENTDARASARECFALYAQIE